MIRGKLDLNWLKFYGERNTGLPAITAPRLQTIKETLTTSNTHLTYSDFPCHFKVNSDKPALTFRRWKSKRGKRLTITANFQERNLGTALSGKNTRPVGRIVKAGPVTCAWLANQIRGFRNPARSDWMLEKKIDCFFVHSKIIAELRRPEGPPSGAP